MPEAEIEARSVKEADRKSVNLTVELHSECHRSVLLRGLPFAHVT